MRAITLSKGDFSLLEKIAIAEQLSSFNPVSQGEYIVLEGTREQFEILMDVISDELSVNGFSNNFEPTGYGRALESIIDVISVIYE